MKIKLVKGGTKSEIEKRTRVVSTAGQISHSDKGLFELHKDRFDHEDNIKAIGRIVGSGHTSITEHDQLTFFITEVTPVIEQILIGQRLASFTIKSRRYVDFSNSGFYVPDFSYLTNGKEIEKKYKEHMNYLFDTYSKMTEQGVPKEDARFILPYCFHSQIAMSLNTRSLIKLIEYCLTSNMSRIDEVKHFGLGMLEIAKEIVPYYKKEYTRIDKILEENKPYEDKLSFLDKYKTKYEILKKPNLISVQTDYERYPMSKVDRTIIVSNLMNRYQIDLEKANKLFDKLSEKEKEQIMDVICMAKENRELEQVSFKFELPTTLAGLTHLTRHRIHSLLIPDFLPIYDLNNQVIPETIKEKCLDSYLEAVNKNLKVYEEFKQLGVEEKDLVYFNLSGTMINVSTNINGRELMLMSRLRCCNRAQWEVRELLNEMVKLVQNESAIYGEYLGAPCAIEGKCPEGKHSCGNPYTYKRSIYER